LTSTPHSAEAALQKSEARLQLALEQLRAQEAELRLVTDHAPVSLAHCDSNERLVFVNRAYAARFGLTPDQVVGKSIAEVVGAEAYASLRTYVEEATAGRQVEFEISVPYADGARFMHCSYTPEAAPTDGKVGFVAVIQDMTERRAGEDTIRRHERELRSLADNTPDILTRFDRQLRHVFVNTAVEAATGRRPEELLGKTNRELGVSGELCDRWEAALRGVFASGRSEVLEFILNSPYGAPYY
jgi:PAS domain S-box-containing protein